MNIRVRFALFSIFLTGVIVLGTSYGSLYFLRALVLKEIKSSQLTVAQNFKKICEDPVNIKDDLLIFNYSASLQRTVKAIAYAAFANEQRKIILGKTPALTQALG